MAKARSVLVTKRQLLEACDAVARTHEPSVARGFRPGRSLPAVRKAIRALAVREPFVAGELCLALAQALVDHEPWDALPHHLVEPLYDALRTLRLFPEPPRPLQANTIEESACAIRHGRISVRGDLVVRGTLLLTGSLSVSGMIHAAGDSWSSGTLIVLGDVRAARMNCLGPCAIGGTLRLKHGLSTAYYHDTDSSLIARRIEAPIWIDRGDIAGRVHGAAAIPRRLRFQRWIPVRLPKYFDGESRRVDWRDFDAAFYRQAIKAADAERRL
jgi:hypothetical protein